MIYSHSGGIFNGFAIVYGEMNQTHNLTHNIDSIAMRYTILEKMIAYAANERFLRISFEAISIKIRRRNQEKTNLLIGWCVVRTDIGPKSENFVRWEGRGRVAAVIDMLF